MFTLVPEQLWTPHWHLKLRDCMEILKFIMLDACSTVCHVPSQGWGKEGERVLVTTAAAQRKIVGSLNDLWEPDHHNDT